MEPNPISDAIVRRQPAQELLGLIESMPEKLQQPDEAGFVPLHFAAKYNAPLEAVERIVAGWEDALIAKSTKGWIPLHLAIWNERWDVAKFLIGLSTCSQNIATSNGGFRPLHMAAERGALKVVQVLMAKWPSAVIEQNEYGNLPLHRAARFAKLDVVQCLANEQKQTLWSKGKEEYLPVHGAAMGEELNVVEFLANKEPKTLLAKTRRGNLPLHIAARDATLEIVKFLVEKYPGALWETNKQGKLPVDKARDSPKESKQETIAWLESAMRNEYPHPSPFLRQALTVDNPPVDNPPVDNACVICWGRAADLVYVPCGHMCVCGACAPLHAANAPLRNNVRVVRCPYCNGTTEKSVKVIPSGLLA